MRTLATSMAAALMGVLVGMAIAVSFPARSQAPAPPVLTHEQARRQAAALPLYPRDGFDVSHIPPGPDRPNGKVIIQAQSWRVETHGSMGVEGETIVEFVTGPKRP